MNHLQFLNLHLENSVRKDLSAMLFLHLFLHFKWLTLNLPNPLSFLGQTWIYWKPPEPRAASVFQSQRVRVRRGHGQGRQFAPGFYVLQLGIVQENLDFRSIKTENWSICIEYE